MSKEEIDVQAERAKFMQKREEKLAAENTIEERDELETQATNPPAVRATDGGRPGTKERNPLEVAKELDADGVEDDTDNDGIPTVANTIPQIKAYLDAHDITYDGVTKKDDLLALIP